jgi:hypothetical protein
VESADDELFIQTYAIIIKLYFMVMHYLLSGIIQFVQSGYGEGSKENFKAAIEKILGK